MAPGIVKKNTKEEEDNNNENPEASNATFTKVPDSSLKDCAIPSQPNQKSQEELHAKPSLFGTYETALGESTSKEIPTFFGSLLTPNIKNVIFGVENVSKPCTTESVTNTSAIQEHSEVCEMKCSSKQLASSSIIPVDYDISLDTNISKGTFLDRNYLKDDYQILENNSFPNLTDDIPVIDNYTEGTINKTFDENIHDQCNKMEQTAIVENNLNENLNERETNINCIVFDSTETTYTQKRDMSVQPFVVRVQRIKTPTIQPTNGLNLAKQKTISKKAHRKLQESLFFNEDLFQMSVSTQTPYNLRTTKARTKHKKQEPIIINSKKNNRKLKSVTKAKIGQREQPRVIDLTQRNANYVQQVENLRSEDPQSSRNLRDKHLHENYVNRFRKSQLNRLLAEAFSNCSRDNQSTGCQYCRHVKRLQRNVTSRRNLLHDIFHKNLSETNPELISHMLHSVEEPASDAEVLTSSTRVTTNHLLKSLKNCLKKMTSLVTYLDFLLDPHANNM
ncbi:uncharacterized protein LOC119678234 [Teleopsis dalmanni]|uniref:uncharacterized protein LOC119678233 n=1 Tax=Teleopsis dalmanni TaxID=139649 RepID=UPI0018CC95F1|nr:uncharacterized protein LOC119678233 [Teleopsis dalmanni]XP_037945880.1 uncharacterized protein LOC119678234 [Teleopsis dalmanni]XP_037945881.1 uncharacterized protein LOC119678234 [Teleopsis dalmanni]